MAAETVTIDRLGREGDGIASGPKGPVFVPFTLAGEEVAIARNGDHGTLISLKTPSPARIAPACRHFGPDGENGTCGGCSLQHIDPAGYTAFKTALVTDALAMHGIDCPVEPLIAASRGERRRATFAARKTENGILLGFSSPSSHHIVSIAECPVLLPTLIARLPAFRLIAGILAETSEAFRIAVTEVDNGLDIAFSGLKKPSEQRRQAAIKAALTLKGIARLCVEDEVLVEPEKPRLDLDGTIVTPPPAAFSQASRRAEEAMAAIVVDHLKGAKRVADLFSGFGTFALRLAKKAHVHAVESHGPALAALDHAARNRQGLKPVTIERRDLFRRPLMPQELKSFDGLVFDPPRAGAKEQAQELARAAVPKIVAVSCNPSTLARDLEILVAAGYRLDRVVPIDQFLWSPHVEAVACLTKAE